VSDVVDGDGLRLRRATLDDADFLAELAGHDDVEPFMSVRRARDTEAVREEIERSLAEPDESGRFVIEVEEDGSWRRAGAMGFDLACWYSGAATLCSPVSSGSIKIKPCCANRRAKSLPNALP